MSDAVRALSYYSQSSGLFTNRFLQIDSFCYFDRINNIQSSI